MSPYRQGAAPKKKKKRWICACVLPTWTWRFLTIKHDGAEYDGWERGPDDPPAKGRVYIRCGRCRRVWMIDTKLDTRILCSDEHAEMMGFY